MKLNIHERLVALNILPKEGNFVTLKIMRKLRENLSFNEEEIMKNEMIIDKVNGNVSWKNFDNDGKPILYEKEIEMGEKTSELIVEALKNLDKEKKLSEMHFSLWEKFVENKGG